MSSRIVFVALGMVSAALCSSAWSQSTVRVNVSTNGAQAQSDGSGSTSPSISGDGRFVAFTSSATNLVAGDTNAATDIFVRDRLSNVTTRVSVASSGSQTQGAGYASISADGRYVAFASSASDLVNGDTNGFDDVFVHDRKSGLTERVNVDSSNAQANDYSSLQSSPSISADGRFVAFSSRASNLVAGDDNGLTDVFVRDRLSGTTERISVDSSGAEGNDQSSHFSRPAISGDGRYVAFESLANNLVPNDTNGQIDIFVHDRQNGATERVSVDSAGLQADQFSFGPSISADGRYVAFTSSAANLVLTDTNATLDVFVHDRQEGTTERVSVDRLGAQGDGQSGSRTSISGDGRFVAFESFATNLVAGDTNGQPDIFVHEREAGVTLRANVDTFGAQANNYSAEPALSADGRFVAFWSHASNLVPGDTNGQNDVFVHDREACSTNVATYCTAKVNSANCTPMITSSGTPSATASSAFLIGAEQVLDQQLGVLFYSVHGPGGDTFQGGFLCATPPTRRTPLSSSSSVGAPPCTGLYSLDFNARVASGVDSALVVGQQVWAQYWTRDGGVPSGTGLTNGLTFTICQ